MQHWEQLGIRQGLSGRGGLPAKVALFLSGSTNPQWPGRGRIWLGHSQLPGWSPQAGLCTYQIHVCARLSTFAYSNRQAPGMYWLQSLFCLCCRAWRPPVLLTLVGHQRKSASYPIIMTALSRPTTLWHSDCTEMTITCILTASCVTGKTKHCGWRWPSRFR